MKDSTSLNQECVALGEAHRQIREVIERSREIVAEWDVEGPEKVRSLLAVLETWRRELKVVPDKLSQQLATIRHGIEKYRRSVHPVLHTLIEKHRRVQEEIREKLEVRAEAPEVYDRPGAKVLNSGVGVWRIRRFFWILAAAAALWWALEHWDGIAAWLDHQWSLTPAP